MNEDVELCDRVLEKLSEAKTNVGEKKVEVKLELDYDEILRLQDMIFAVREMSKC